MTIIPTNPLQTYTDIIFTGPGSNYLHNNWNNGIAFIMDNCNNNPPHFRSTWRHFLHGNNKAQFESILERLITAILASHTTHNSEAFWWLLFHFDMLILAPTPKRLRDNMSIKSIIFQRLTDFQSGNIDSLLHSTRFNVSRRGNSASKIAADSDNYCTTIARACTFKKNCNHQWLQHVHSQWTLPQTSTTTPARTNTSTTNPRSASSRQHLQNNQTIWQEQRHRITSRLHWHLHLTRREEQPQH